jgi:quinoprotein glucose dehydrogenase
VIDDLVIVGAAIVQLYPRQEAQELRAAQPAGGMRLEAEVGSMLSTPYLLKRTYLLDVGKSKLPYTKPPWGTLAAVNLQSVRLQFEVPLGTMLDSAQYPDAVYWGSISLGGPLTTAGGLILVAATMDGHLRAFDSDTG